MSLREIVKSGRSVTISFVSRNIRGPVCDRSLVFVFVFEAIFEAQREGDENTMSVVLNISNIVTKIVVQKSTKRPRSISTVETPCEPPTDDENRSNCLCEVLRFFVSILDTNKWAADGRRK